LSVLIIDFYELNLTELFKIQSEQISDVKVFAFGGAHTGKIYMRDAVRNFESAVACETVIDTDPTEGSSFDGTGTFEIFIQSSL